MFLHQIIRLLILVGFGLASIFSQLAHGQPAVSHPWQRPESARDMLSKVGLEFTHFIDYAALPPDTSSPSEIEQSLRIISRLRQAPLVKLSDWAARDLDLKSIAQDPNAHRGVFLELRGHLTKFEQIKLDPALVQRFDVPSIYRLSIDGDTDFEIWTTEIPSPWPTEWPLDRPFTTPIRAQALFTRLAPKFAESGEASPIFLTSRIAWLPDQVSAELKITESLAKLGQAGFDVSLLEAVHAEKSKRLTAVTAEPFYQLLAVQSKLDQSTLKSAPLELASLIARPQDLIGEAIEFEAIARRVVEIPIDDAADRERLELDRYYEIDLALDKPTRTFVQLGNGQKKEVIQNDFPLTLCTTALPPGLVVGDDMRVAIHAKAFFFKLWAYESKFASANAGDALQVSPLFVACSVEIVPPPENSAVSAIWVLIGAVLLLGSVGVWGYLVLRQDDKKERRQKALLGDSFTPPAPPPAAL